MESGYHKRLIINTLFEDVRCRVKQKEVGMSQKTFSLTAGVVFLLVAVAHLLRMLFGLSIEVQGVAAPMWVSGIGLIIAGYLAYEGFQRARKSP
jgi:hypothetical protein